jgi:hypothetical protein
MPAGLALVVQVCERPPAVIADGEARAVVLNLQGGGKRRSGTALTIEHLTERREPIYEKAPAVWPAGAPMGVKNGRRDG